jgi:hypothetical protein
LEARSVRLDQVQADEALKFMREVEAAGKKRKAKPLTGMGGASY